MISEEMIWDGYRSGLVRLIDSPNDGEAVCQIGEYWFYFWDGEQGLSSEKLMRRYQPDTIIHAIWTSLEACKRELEFGVEYSYYESVLRGE